jgi:hypothetical protein
MTTGDMKEAASYSRPYLDGAVARRAKALTVLTLTAAVGIGWLAAGLSPEAFFAGDSGLKLIAALNTLDHPTRPFEVDLPTIGGRPVPYVDPMVMVHDTHAHVLQSPVFPAISAPFIAMFGIRGAYLLPAIAFVVLLPMLNAMRRHAAPDTSFAALAWIALAANPLLFYSLEYWEHAPAVALFVGSTALALIGSDRARAEYLVASGVLGGLSVLLRPEAVWYLTGLVLIIDRRQWIGFGCGAAAILVPFAAANVLHSGTPLGPHASANLAPLLRDNFLAARWQRLDAWLWPHSAVATVGFALIAIAWIARRFNVELRTRQIIALFGAAAISVLAAERLIPRESLWQGFPIALLALVPTATLAARTRHLYVLAGLTVAGIVVTSTHDGGAQWGARFLLVTAPPLIILAARGATDAACEGRWRRLRVALVALVLIAGLATSRAAYRELRGSKREYQRIVSATASLTSPASVILTNVWWFDSVTASLYGSREFLYLPSRTSVTQALTEISRANVTRATLVWTTEPGGESLESAVEGTCFTVPGVESIPQRGLRLAHARCPRR